MASTTLFFPIPASSPLQTHQTSITNHQSFTHTTATPPHTLPSPNIIKIHITLSLNTKETTLLYLASYPRTSAIYDFSLFNTTHSPASPPFEPMAIITTPIRPSSILLLHHALKTQTDSALSYASMKAYDGSVLISPLPLHKTRDSGVTR